MRKLGKLVVPWMFIGLLQAPSEASPTNTMICDLRMPKSILDLIVAESMNQGINPEIALGIAFRESRDNPMAFNKHSKAMGLFQFMPRTIAILRVTHPFNPKQSTIAGVGLLAHWKRVCGSDKRAIRAFAKGHCK